MIVQLTKSCSEDELKHIEQTILSLGAKCTRVTTQMQRYLIAIGTQEIDIRRVGSLRGVLDVHEVSDSYKLVSRKWKTKPTLIDLGDGATIGEESFQFIAGPCSIEDEEQISKIVDHLVEKNIRIMRGGVFKPRTSPYSFRGGGVEALKLFAHIAHSKGIKIVSEVLEPSQIEAMYPYVDMYQVGARNSQNFSLLNELGRVDKAVLIKRGISGTIDELLQSAEYVFSAGNERILLCERGIRTFETASRNTLDINAIPILKEKTHLPVIIDPSHGIGIRRFVEQVALAGIVAGADGVLVEIHPAPECAKSDGDQTLNFEESSRLFQRGEAIRRARYSY